MVGFDERRLLGAASERWGVPEPLEAAFRPALRALLDSLGDPAGARLSQVGAWRVNARLVSAIGQRLALAKFERDTPGLDSLVLPAPVFVTGFPRAATTLLHNLLARTPGLWAPRLWELTRPAPPPRIDERWIDRQIHATEAMVEQLYEAAPDFRRLHPLAPTSPDACSWLFRVNFTSLIHAFHWFVPGYVEFMVESMRGADLVPAYRDHRRMVRALAYRHRHDPGTGARMVLEDTWHTGQLHALRRVYPDATVIVVRSEREQALTALARSCWTLQRVDAKRPRSPAEVRRYCATILDAQLAGLARFEDEVGGLIYVDQDELEADPLALVARLAPRLQLPRPQLGEPSRWLANHRLFEAAG